MRPKSIIAFDWLFLGTQVLTVLASPLSIAQGEEMARANPAMAQFAPIMEIVMIGSVIIGCAVSLMLWFFVSRRASNTAKWIIFALAGYGVLSVANSYVTPTPGMQVPVFPTLPLYVLHIAAVYCLFRKDAVAWLEGKAPVNINDFE